jgi:hypothetical protein
LSSNGLHNIITKDSIIKRMIWIKILS